MKYLKMVSDLSLSRIFILAIFVAAGYFVSYFDPGTTIEEEIATAKSAVLAQEDRLKETTKILKKEEEMRGNNLALARNLDVIKSRIPIDLKDSQMQQLINESATSSGVTISSIAIIKEEGKVENAPPRKFDSDKIKPEDLIEEIKYKISIISTFDSFLKFLDTLAKEDKVIKIKNFSISKNSQGVEEEKIIFAGEIVGFKQAKIIIETVKK